MANSPLARKLLLKPAARGALLNPPAGYVERLQPLPDGVDLSDQAGRELDFVQVFVRDLADLERIGPAAVDAVRADGVLWVCYPKGGRRAGTDLSRDVLWNALAARGLSGVTLVSVDDTWSAMRFRPAELSGT